MGEEEGNGNSGNSECVEGVQCLKRKVIHHGFASSNGNGVAEEARNSKNGVAEEARQLKTEVLNDGTVFANGNGVADVDGVLKSDYVNDGFVFVNGNGVAEETRHSKSEVVNGGAVFANRNSVADVDGVLKIEFVNDGAVFSNGNSVVQEARYSKLEVGNDGAVFANGNGFVDVVGVLTSNILNNGINENGVVEEARLLKSEPISNGAAISDGFYSSDGGFAGRNYFRTYKRRKYDKSSSKGKAQEDRRKFVETASHIADQGTSKIGKNGQEFSSQLDCLSHRTHSEANGHAHVIQNESSSEPHNHGVTDMCQRVLCNVLNSEKFSSLCKILLENFHGTNPESAFDFSVIKSKMKQKTYEQSPGLFLLDIQQVWRKVEDSCNEMLALAKSLSNISTNSYSELVGISAQSTFEDGKQVESDSHMKLEQTEEYAANKSFCCSRCGEGADDTNCLVCDSCEKMYHLSCIEPAVKEIPHKSWYCAKCTTSGIGSPHQNCVVCVKLNDRTTPKKIICDESLPRNEETLNEFEDNSNCNYHGYQSSAYGEEIHNCKVCGNDVHGENQIRICGHPYCPSKHYHVRCLTSKQLKSYGQWWYCPSCLCQVCLIDQNDDQIVLCDACDHAYHIYCLKPALDSIPTGDWFCKKCDAGIKAISLAKKAYESNKLRSSENASKPNANNENNCNNKCVKDLENGGGMDMLLTAAKSLNF